MPDAITCSTVISACGKAGQLQPALRLLHDMPGRRLLSDTITCSTAVSACEKAGRAQLAMRLLHDCLIAPAADAITGSAVIRT